MHNGLEFLTLFTVLSKDYKCEMEVSCSSSNKSFILLDSSRRKFFTTKTIPCTSDRDDTGGEELTDQCAFFTLFDLSTILHRLMLCELRRFR